MKVLFFFALLTNIVYFLWQYQQGALEKNLTEPLELKQNAKKQILLLTEVAVTSTENNPVSSKTPVINKVPKSTFKEKTLSENSKTKVLVSSSVDDKNKTALIAKLDKSTTKQCYQVGVFSNDTAIDKWAEKIGLDSALLQKYQKNKPSITAYLVYYPVGETFSESKKNLKMLKELGIKETWLFKKGEFKGEISLGMFKTKAKAMQLQKEFFAKSIFAELKPRYQFPPKIYVNLQTDKTAQQLKTLLKGLVKKTSIKPLKKCF